jgi:DNA polymerase family A
MTWQSALRAVNQRLKPDWAGAIFRPKEIDWDRLVSLDFETYWDEEYTLKKMSTSEYVRDPRFKAQMLGLKIGRKPTRIIAPKNIRAELKKINWSTHSLLCQNTAFDGLILSHHYGVVPTYYFDTMSMARGLHSSEIGSGLEEISVLYGGTGKLKDVLETTRGVRDWSPALFNAVTPYCANDNEEMFRVFIEMVPKMPDVEMDLIDLTIRMFCDPVLLVDIPRVERELARELAERDTLMQSIVDCSLYYNDKTVLKKTVERALTGKERNDLIVKRIVGSSEKFADLLRAEDVEPPVKISEAWIKKPRDQRDDAKKWTYAFASDDLDFTNLPHEEKCWTREYDLSDPAEIKLMAEKRTRLQALVDVRIAVKSTSNITKAQRFLTAGANGMKLPVGYSYYRAHTGRFGGNNKMNMQNLERGGELRLSILAPPGHVLVVTDSGQIEARVNAWLWGQDDLLDAFRAADVGVGVDAYCRFASAIYARSITKADKTERFVGKVCVLGLGYQMGPAKLQITLAKGALGGPPIFLSLEECTRIVNTYRRMNHRIQSGWQICERIINDMANGHTGQHGPISWGANAIYLPNGMSLKYPDLKKARGDKGWDEWTYGGVSKGKPIRKKIYGGLLCENIVQALSRVIVAGEQMLAINKVQRVVMTTHDETVSCVKKAQAELAYRRQLKIMMTPPAWAPDLPLNAEGGYAENYSK